MKKYFESNNLEGFENDLLELIELKKKELGKDKIAFACIGEPSVNFDAIGPKIGTILKGDGYNVIGTAEEPLNVSGILRMRDKINELHKDHVVIAIDASAVRDRKELNKFVLKDIGIRPGAGVGRDIDMIGDIGIAVCTVVTTPSKRIADHLDFTAIHNLINKLYKEISNI